MHNSFSPSDNLLHKVDVYFCQGGERMGRPSFSPPLTSNFIIYAYSGQSNWRLAEFFPTPLTICTTVFPHVITLCIRLMFNLVRVGNEWASPVFPHPLTSNLMFYVYSGQGNLRLAEFFPTSLTICTTVVPHVKTLCIWLMVYLVRVGKEWALSGWGKNGPAKFFPTPEKAKVTCVFVTGIRKVWLCFSQTITIYHMHNRFPHLITFWTRLTFNLVMVGKNWAGPVFPHPKTNVN